MEAFICETDIFIEREFKPDTDVVMGMGYKHRLTTAVNGSFGGMSNIVVKTGGVPTEVYIFNMQVKTGIAADANEGFRLILSSTEGDELTTVFPFESIAMELRGFNVYNDSSSTDDIWLVEAADGYRVDGTKHDVITETDQKLLRWFADNINNTPYVKLKCYPGEEVVEED